MRSGRIGENANTNTNTSDLAHNDDVMTVPETNDLLDFQSLHRYPGASGASVRANLNLLAVIERAHSGKPFVLSEFGYATETVDPIKISEAVDAVFDLRPAAILRDLDLRRPIYRRTAAYGHFGRSEKDFTWERLSRLDDFKRALNLS